MTVLPLTTYVAGVLASAFTSAHWVGPSLLLTGEYLYTILVVAGWAATGEQVEPYETLALAEAAKASGTAIAAMTARPRRVLRMVGFSSIGVRW